MQRSGSVQIPSASGALPLTRSGSAVGKAMPETMHSTARLHQWRSYGALGCSQDQQECENSSFRRGCKRFVGFQLFQLECTPWQN